MTATSISVGIEMSVSLIIVDPKRPLKPYIPLGKREKWSTSLDSTGHLVYFKGYPEKLSDSGAFLYSEGDS